MSKCRDMWTNIVTSGLWGSVDQLTTFCQAHLQSKINIINLPISKTFHLSVTLGIFGLPGMDSESCVFEWGLYEYYVL